MCATTTATSYTAKALSWCDGVAVAHVVLFEANAVLVPRLSDKVQEAVAAYRQVREGW